MKAIITTLLLMLLIGCVQEPGNNNDTPQVLAPEPEPTVEPTPEPEEPTPTPTPEVVNNLPTITGLTSVTISEGDSFFVTPTIEDIDGDELEVLVTNIPVNGSYVDGTLYFDPDYEQSGQYEILFTVSDGEDEVSQTITITVDNENRAPVLDEITNPTISENLEYTLEVNATDLDGDVIGLSANNLPSGSDFTNGVFTWTPSCEQASTYEVEFVADDGQYTDAKIVTIEVTETNCYAPTWTTAPSLYSGDGTLTAVVKVGSATDADGETPTYYFDNKEFDCNNINWTQSYSSSLNRLTITKPSTTDWGSHYFLMYAEDSSGLRDYRFVKINFEFGDTWNVEVLEQTSTWDSSNLCGGLTVYQH